ncbi:hypothetical protein [Brevinema andersonii]|nr:hypothetical protein [Brevinema andersonii]
MISLLKFVAPLKPIIAYFTAKASRGFGRKYQENIGDINSAFLESLYG